MKVPAKLTEQLVEVVVGEWTMIMLIANSEDPLEVTMLKRRLCGSIEVLLERALEEL